LRWRIAVAVPMKEPFLLLIEKVNGMARIAIPFDDFKQCGF
jgi:hypothetical protein